MFNHLSIVGLGFAILLNILAISIKSDDLRKLSCWFYILLGFLAALAILTGDSAGEIIKTYPGISSDAIENHETWGYVFFYGLLANGILGLGTLWFSRKNPGLMKKLNLVMLVVALAFSILAFKTGATGGTIRHPEIEQGPFKNNG